ncbi:MAG: pilin [Candidatus Falkowbacteria bacterium]
MKMMLRTMLIMFCLVVLAQPLIALAKSSYFTEKATEYTLKEGLETAGKGVFATSNEKTLPERIGQVIQYLLSLVGVIFLVMIVMGGIMWMTGGDSPQVKKAQQRIANAVIGLIITLLAYVVVSFVITEITKLTEVPAAPVVPPAAPATPAK